MQPSANERTPVEVAPGVMLDVAVHGPRTGVPLMLLHGWGNSARWWAPVTALLRDRHRVIVPDQRMHGASLALAAGRDVPVSIRALADDVVAVLDALGEDRAVLVGHSMGGQVAAVAADRRPDRVAGTVVADPSYGASDEEIAAAPQRRAQHLALARARRAVVPANPGAEEERHFAALAELYDSQYLRPDSVGARRDTAALLRRRTRQSLTVYSTETAAAVELELSRGCAVHPEVVVWPGVSHDFPVQRPEMFASLVRDWSRRAAATP
ncbi:alpha/beta fold hydrolase [Glycomyces sp. MUSA5-2]|uniref:alpha/beta fold hydrolase n=1 Tax=Glycomyces sp. MUSA5-2 TaxID=2053002 RepID=UPI003009EF7D